MVMGTTTFIAVFVAAVVLCGLFIFLKFRAANKTP